MHDLPLPQGRVVDQVRRVAILVDVLGRGHHDINSRACAGEVPVDIPANPVAIELAALDDQEISVAVRTHLISRGRPEEDDLVRFRGFDDALNDFGQDLLVYLPVFAMASFVFHGDW